MINTLPNSSFLAETSVFSSESVTNRHRNVNTALSGDRESVSKRKNKGDWRLSSYHGATTN